MLPALPPDSRMPKAHRPKGKAVACPSCLRTLEDSASPKRRGRPARGCKNRNCRKFIGQRDSADRDLNSLDRAARLAAQPQKRAPRVAGNCRALRLTMRAER